MENAHASPPADGPEFSELTGPAVVDFVTGPAGHA